MEFNTKGKVLAYFKERNCQYVGGFSPGRQFLPTVSPQDTKMLQYVTTKKTFANLIHVCTTCISTVVKQ